MFDQNNVTTPSDSYNFWEDNWRKYIAVVNGEAAVKKFDETMFPMEPSKNILTPFSPKMSPVAYEYYKAGAELPGYSVQQLRTIISALLRKPIGITLPEGFTGDSNEALDWLLNQILVEGAGLTTLIRNALEDDLVTGNTWLLLDLNQETKTPVVEVLPGRSIISYEVGNHPLYGPGNLVQVVVRRAEESKDDDNATVITYTYDVHFIDEDGVYKIHQLKQDEDDVVALTDEPIIPTRSVQSDSGGTESAYFDQILLFPMDGKAEISSPFLSNFINREISLYKQMAKRNAMTTNTTSFTPVIKGASDEESVELANFALGQVVSVGKDVDVDVLSPDTKGLDSVNKTIEDIRQDLQMIGSRQLVRDSRASGTALELTNSPYNSILYSLSSAYATTLRRLITTAFNWRYGTSYAQSDFGLTLSVDLADSPTGVNAVQYVLQLFFSGNLPRRELLTVLKANGILSNNYEDTAGENFQEVVTNTTEPLGEGSQ